ncbi:hypothetical protein CYPRO_0318 [Cyclonatronum proteinivorum]|uniref:Uncharacterized protein n=1 Tax=Cyclonatronum proteinivorum TaxID=1457365 RepID=A0A345UGK4_9BACT|nr:hypothetical protein [Cyclonatronum proteinivorum]AXI99605.1 hypothetical protein CYPRO_0318 [Cyclonatronum proteinivorum]
MPPYRFKAFAAALLCGFILSWIPLLREVHFLSAGLTGLAGAFTGAIIAGGRSYRNTPAAGLREAFWLLLIFLTPLLPLLAGALWRSCFSGDGLLYWLLIPGPSVLLGFAVGRYMAMHSKRPRFWAVSMLLVVSLGIFVWEFFNYPAVFYHNHVWGFWPGPVYDDVVELRPSLVFFRYITLCWVALLWLMPHWKNRKNLRLPVLLLVASLMLSYFNLSRAGILHNETWIQQQLGGKLETAHAIIYYDRHIPETEIEWLAAWHDFHIAELAELLALEPSSFPKVHSYLYRHEWQKKALTGAGGTVYVPVWLGKPQMHIHWQAAERVLRHELVHVLSREFGAPVINASPVIALVEGLATAFETERDHRGTGDQLVAAQPEFPDHRYMRRLMSLTGFYALDSNLSYTIAGSFTGWLWQHCGADAMKLAYRSGRISRACEQPFDELVDGWHAHLSTIPTDALQFAVSGQIFSAPGITQQPCNFHPGPDYPVLRQVRALTAENRHAEALAFLAAQQSDRRFCDFNSLSLLRADLLMRAGHAQPEELLALFQGCARPPEDLPSRLRLFAADAFFLSGEEAEGVKLLETFQQQAQSVRLRTNPGLREQLLTVLYTPETAAPHYLSAEIKPWLVWHCAQDGNDAFCPELTPDVFLTDAREHFLIWERFMKTMKKQGQHETALAWHAALTNELDDPVSDLARQNRLGDFKRFSEYAHTKTYGF